MSWAQIPAVVSIALIGLVITLAALSRSHDQRADSTPGTKPGKVNFRKTMAALIIVLIVIFAAVVILG